VFNFSFSFILYRKTKPGLKRVIAIYSIFVGKKKLCGWLYYKHVNNSVFLFFVDIVLIISSLKLMFSIDATPSDCTGRYINHALDGNVFPKLITVKEKPRLVFIAKEVWCCHKVFFSIFIVVE
jgi:hypothetical protein